MLNVALNLVPVKAASILFIDPGRSYNRTQWCARECVFLLWESMQFIVRIPRPSVLQMFPGQHWGLMGCYYCIRSLAHPTEIAPWRFPKSFWEFRCYLWSLCHCPQFWPIRHGLPFRMSNDNHILTVVTDQNKSKVFFFFPFGASQK